MFLENPQPSDFQGRGFYDHGRGFDGQGTNLKFRRIPRTGLLLYWALALTPERGLDDSERPRK